MKTRKMMKREVLKLFSPEKAKEIINIALEGKRRYMIEIDREGKECYISFGLDEGDWISIYRLSKESKLKMVEYFKSISGFENAVKEWKRKASFKIPTDIIQCWMSWNSVYSKYYYLHPKNEKTLVEGLTILGINFKCVVYDKDFKYILFD